MTSAVIPFPEQPGIIEQQDAADTFDSERVCWVLDQSRLPVLLDAIARCSECVIDLETTGLNEYQVTPIPARIVLASLTLPDKDHPGDEPITYVVPLYHPSSPLLGIWRAVLTKIVAAIRDADCPITNHNLKFDLRWLAAHTGIDLTRQFAWDTQISSHLLDETSSTKLKERAPATFGIKRWDDFDLKTPGAALTVPIFDLGLYAARDTYWTWKLAVAHRHRMAVGEEGEEALEPETDQEREEQQLGRLATICAIPTSATLTAIEQRGINIDPDWINQHMIEQRGILETNWVALTHRYSDLDASQASFAPTSLWFAAWAERAVEAGDLVVTATTPTGKPQWTKGVLKRQARKGSRVAQQLLDLRAASKQLEFLTAWLEQIGADGKIHTTYHAGRVVTGRLSSSDPNMQQVTGDLKPAFIPSRGYYLADLDYSQVELRVAAFIARCQPMIEAFQRGDDLHRLLAARITGKRPEDVSPQERQQGKSANFGLLYGISPEGFREYAETVYDVILTADEAVMIHAAFFEQWKGMGAWHQRVIARARQTGQVVSPIGRVRRLPDLYSHNDRAIGHAERNAINSPVQGFASDVMQIAAASIEGRIPHHDPVPGVRLVGTVHDSIVVEVPVDDWQRATARCLRRMIDTPRVLARLGCRFDVPLAAEAKIGSRWGLSDVGIIT